MEQSKRGVFRLLDNLKPIEPGALDAFEREMSEHAIPGIIKEVEKRRLLAAESRHRQLEMPSADPGIEPDFKA